MRILMFGWEFPPYITGGLGTACFGLTQELAKITDRLLFVIPKGQGSFSVGQPSPSMNPSAASTREPPRGFEVLSSADSSHSSWSEPASDDSQALFDNFPWERDFEVLGIDSPLQPYMTAADYEQKQASLDADIHTRSVAQAASRADSQTSGTRVAQPSPHSFGRDESYEAETHSSANVADIYGRNLFEEVQRYSRLASQIARREFFDLIHCHDWMTFPAGITAKRLTGRPFVAHVHALEFDRAGDNVDERVYRIERIGLESADRIIAVSHRTAQTIVQRYGICPSKIRVVHNGVSGLPAGVPTRQSKVFEEKVVVFLGRITMQKGPEYFLESAALVRRVFPKVRFVMAGTGDMLPRMMLRAAEMRLNDHFHFTGFINESERARLLGQADLFVMTSVSEPFGLTPGEAAQHDVPIIIPYQSGVSEIFNHAVKIDFWDTHRIADAMIHILQNPGLASQMIQGSRLDVQSANWAIAAQKMCRLYSEVI